MLAVGVGILLGLYPITWLVFAYVLWRYAFMPFRNVAVSLKALDTKLEEHRIWTKNEVGLRKAVAISENELAWKENRIQRARSAWAQEISKSAPSA